MGRVEERWNDSKISFRFMWRMSRAMTLWNLGDKTGLTWILLNYFIDNLKPLINFNINGKEQDRMICFKEKLNNLQNNLVGPKLIQINATNVKGVRQRHNAKLGLLEFLQSCSVPLKKCCLGFKSRQHNAVSEPTCHRARNTKVVQVIPIRIPTPLDQ